MSFIAQTIAKRKTTYFGREHIACGGIAVGFGWGSGLPNEDAVNFQASFLSCGVDSAPDREAYEKRKLKKENSTYEKSSFEKSL